MAFPFSVLNSKREKIVILDDEEEEEKNFVVRENIFETKISDFMALGLYYTQEYLQYIRDNSNYFYHCNIMMLFLTLNCINDQSFIGSPNYENYKKIIIDSLPKRKNKDKNKDEGILYQQALDRINFQILIYSKIIDRVNQENAQNR